TILIHTHRSSTHTHRHIHTHTDHPHTLTIHYRHITRHIDRDTSDTATERDTETGRDAETGRDTADNKMYRQRKKVVESDVALLCFKNVCFRLHCLETVMPIKLYCIELRERERERESERERE